MSFKLKLEADIYNKAERNNILRVTTIESYITEGREPEDLCLIYPTEYTNADRLLSINWGAIVTHNDSLKTSTHQVIHLQEEYEHLDDGDIISILKNQVYIYYKHHSSSNSLFLTERCDNSCIMCSQPPKNHDDSWRVNDAIRIISLLDNTPRTLGITGGEPTLLGNDFLDILQYCHERLPETQLHVLTNGRSLSNSQFIQKINTIGCENILWGIPLYGSSAYEHDYHVQKKGAFSQTINGIYNLSTIGGHIELRVVLTKDVLNNIESISDFIARNLPFISFVAFMGVELIGFAKYNHTIVFSSLSQHIPALSIAIKTLLMNQVQVSLYNIPLCHIPPVLRQFASQSISDWKNTFPIECEQCRTKDICCGFFESNIKYKHGVTVTNLNSINDTVYI